jgi:predicted membrane-bound mannosyltransferase
MDEMELTEADSNMNDLISEYQHINNIKMPLPWMMKKVDSVEEEISETIEIIETTETSEITEVIEIEMIEMIVTEEMIET